MMKIKYVVSILIVLVLLLSSPFILQKYPHLAIEIQMIGWDIENPENDALADMNAHNKKCISVNGFGPYFPGVETKRDKKICSKAKEVNIFGTSDGIVDLKHAYAISKAKKYAFKYNKYIVENTK
ncbi:MAG: hypothetical protein OEX19_06835 [Gammaproteobacteria bacterium]|nr:hypothetical protein [Gammaproteobacteria bacterium]